MSPVLYHRTNLGMTCTEKVFGPSLGQMQENQPKVNFRNWSLNFDDFHSNLSGNNISLRSFGVTSGGLLNSLHTLDIDSSSGALVPRQQQSSVQEKIDVQPLHHISQSNDISSALSSALSILGGADSLTDMFAFKEKRLSNRTTLSGRESPNQNISPLMNSPCEQSILTNDFHTNTKVFSSQFVLHNNAEKEKHNVIFPPSRSKSTDAIQNTCLEKEKVKRFPSLDTKTLATCSLIDIHTEVLCPSI
jgi:hypothetical protein